jgi:biotin carboxylase
MSGYVVITGTHNLDMAKQALHALGLEAYCVDLGESAPGAADTHAPEVEIERCQDADAFIDAVLAACDRLQPRALLTNSVDDWITAVESRLIEPLAERDIPALVHPERAATVCLDKARTKELARRVGVAAPEGRIVRRGDDAEFPPAAADDLFVFKRLDQSAGDGQHILPSTGPFDHLDFQDGPYLVERFISGLEFSINVFATADSLYFLPPIVKGPTRPDNTHALDRPRLVVPDLDPSLQASLTQTCRELCAALGPSGWIEYEFALDGKRPCLLEANARFSGTSRISWLGTGVNPYYVALETLLTQRRQHGSAQPDYIVELPLAEPLAPAEDGAYTVYYSSRPRPGRIGRQLIQAPSWQELLDRIARHAPADRRDAFLDDVMQYRDVMSSTRVAEG